MDDIAVVRCFLCKNDLIVREDKQGKPYLVCYSCWSQTFIRGPYGKRRLLKRMRFVSGERLEKLREALNALQKDR